jgi:hypothetical protein
MFLPIRIALCRLLQSPQFIIRIEKGIVSKAAGRVHQGFINDCQDVARFNNLQSGFVYATAGQYGKSVLHGSREIPKDMLQQLRNTLHV